MSKEPLKRLEEVTRRTFGEPVAHLEDLTRLEAEVDRLTLELAEYRIFDFRYLCTAGHHVTDTRKDLDTCSAVLPWPKTADSKRCGAQLFPYQARDKWEGR